MCEGIGDLTACACNWKILNVLGKKNNTQHNNKHDMKGIINGLQ